MKTKFALPCLLTLLCSLPASADKFTLKDGTLLEGVIVSDDGITYTIDVVVGKGIKDERKLSKSEVVKIEKEPADVKAFTPLSKLVPTPDLLTPGDYAQYCGALEAFLKNHIASPKIKEAKALLETLKAEAAQVANGAVKLNGQMISAADYQTNAYEYDARIQEAKIRAMINNGYRLPALRAFTEFDREFRSTRSYSMLSPLVRGVMFNHVAEARQLLVTLDDRLKQREAGLARMNPDDRRSTEEAIREEDAAIDARFKGEKAGPKTWVTPAPYHKGSLDETVRFGEAEIARYSAVRPVIGADGGQAYRDALALIHNGAPQKDVTAAITAAKTVGVAPRYLAILDVAAKANARDPKTGKPLH